MDRVRIRDVFRPLVLAQTGFDAVTDRMIVVELDDAAVAFLAHRALRTAEHVAGVAGHCLVAFGVGGLIGQDVDADLTDLKRLCRVIHFAVLEQIAVVFVADRVRTVHKVLEHAAVLVGLQQLVKRHALVRGIRVALLVEHHELALVLFPAVDYLVEGCPDLFFRVLADLDVVNIEESLRNERQRQRIAVCVHLHRRRILTGLIAFHLLFDRIMVVLLQFFLGEIVAVRLVVLFELVHVIVRFDAFEAVAIVLTLRHADHRVIVGDLLFERCFREIAALAELLRVVLLDRVDLLLRAVLAELLFFVRQRDAAFLRFFRVDLDQKRLSRRVFLQEGDLLVGQRCSRVILRDRIERHHVIEHGNACAVCACRGACALKAVQSVTVLAQVQSQNNRGGDQCDDHDRDHDVSNGFLSFHVCSPESIQMESYEFYTFPDRLSTNLRHFTTFSRFAETPPCLRCVLCRADARTAAYLRTCRRPSDGCFRPARRFP